MVSKEMVVCYLLASLSVNIDGDWLLTICAKFLLIKGKVRSFKQEDFEILLVNSMDSL